MDTMHTNLTYPSIEYKELYRTSLVESYAQKLGSFAGRSVSFLQSKRGKKLALQSYIITEAIITFISIISLIMAGIYFPAILLGLMMGYLVYATIDLMS